MLIGVGGLLVMFPWLEPTKENRMEKQFDPRCLTVQQKEILNSFQPFQQDTKYCYQCNAAVSWLAPDGRCKDCTRLTVEEVSR